MTQNKTLYEKRFLDRDWEYLEEDVRQTLKEVLEGIEKKRKDGLDMCSFHDGHDGLYIDRWEFDDIVREMIEIIKSKFGDDFLND